MRAPDDRLWGASRVLVTGDTGFAGAWLALWLEALGAHVTGFSRQPPGPGSTADALGVARPRVSGDVTDRDAVRRALATARPDVVFHLAGQSVTSRALVDPVATYATNVVGTAVLLEAARDAGVRAVVVTTSHHVYAQAPSDRALRETDALGATSPYGAAKACADLVVSALARTGVAAATARTGNLVGGGDRVEGRLLTDLMRALDEGTTATLRDPGAELVLLHVLDAARAYLLLAERLAAGAGEETAFNVGGAGPPLPAAAIADHVGAPWRPARDAPGGPRPPAPRLDLSRAHDLLGWRPAWTAHEALDAVVAWHRARAAGEDMKRFALGQVEQHSSTLSRP